jgi:hypothetical protein
MYGRFHSPTVALPLNGSAVGCALKYGIPKMNGTKSDYSKLLLWLVKNVGNNISHH